jgi:TonB family protein
VSLLLSSRIEPWVLSYLFNAVWQIPLVFAAALVAARMLHNADPRVEHRMWVGALLLEIGLPACDLRIASVWESMRAALSSWYSGDLEQGHTRVVFGSATINPHSLHLPPALLTGIALAWMACLLYFAARLAWGLWQTHILARAAVRLTLSGDAALRWKHYCHTFQVSARAPEIAESPHGSGPITIGIRRRLLLLPPRFLEDITAADLDVIFAHEFAHIARHDFAKNLLYGMLSLPVAWHPLLWMTRAHLDETRELICDAIAAKAVAGPKEYARSLLRLAAMLSSRAPVSAIHALAILNITTDARTLERRVMTLTHKRSPMTAARRVVLAIACSLIALTTCTSALALHTDVGALNPFGATGTPAQIHVESGVMAGQKISGGNPVYPPEDKAKKVHGTVVLAVTIGKDGVPQDIRVKKSPSASLSRSAADAVRTWHYRPYLLNGEPVEVQTTINVTYNLHD